MKRKPIRIDWDELEAAFDNPNEELVYYLDLVNGHVVLEGEGEEDEYHEDDEHFPRGAPAESAPAPVSDGTRAYVERLTTETKVGWISRFVAEVGGLDDEWAARLEAAVEADDPAQAIIDVLADNPEGKERWYLYRADRLHDLIDAWLEREEVALVEGPPWSGDASGAAGAEGA